MTVHILMYETLKQWSQNFSRELSILVWLQYNAVALSLHYQIQNINMGGG